MNNVIPTLKYLWLTLKHKAFVFYAGLRFTGASWWLLLIHDWSKFTPSEAPHYGRQFFGDKSDPEGFARAWLHHQNNNPHHWEYWISRTSHIREAENGSKRLPMPEKYINEMIADWMGAGRAYEGKWPEKHNWEWLNANLDRILNQTHIETQILILRKLISMGYLETYYVPAHWGERIRFEKFCEELLNFDWGQAKARLDAGEEPHEL